MIAKAQEDVNNGVSKEKQFRDEMNAFDSVTADLIHKEVQNQTQPCLMKQHNQYIDLLNAQMKEVNDLIIDDDVPDFINRQRQENIAQSDIKRKAAEESARKGKTSRELSERDKRTKQFEKRRERLKAEMRRETQQREANEDKERARLEEKIRTQEQRAQLKEEEDKQAILLQSQNKDEQQRLMESFNDRTRMMT